MNDLGTLRRIPGPQTCEADRRDLFAAVALHSMLNRQAYKNSTIAALVDRSYAIADAMLAKSKEPHP